MLLRIVSVSLLLFVVLPYVLAAEIVLPGQSQPSGVISSPATDSSRLIAAEVAKTIKSEMSILEQQVKDNEDENFRILDARTQQMMLDIKIRMILGGVGAVLLANAIVALVMSRFWRQYSFETYQKNIIDKVSAERDEMRSRLEAQGMQQMQQSEWTPQEVGQTIGKEFGQASAANMSMMNQWQTQPAHQGAWVSPMDSDVQRYEHRAPERVSSYQEQVDADWGVQR